MNGQVTSVTLNTGDTIWTLRGQDARFLPVGLGMGKLNLAFSYDLRGNVTSRSATRAVGDTIQWLTYTYSAGTGNMTSRTDMVKGLEEEFGYDSMNRLTDISLTEPYNSQTEQELLYDGKGNILSRTDAGQFGYNAALPYALSELSSPAGGIPMRDQHISYNAMQQPDTIIENGYTATFSYYGDRSRASMMVAGPNGYQFSGNYYDQRYNYFTKTENNVTTHKTVLWLGGSPYSAPAAMLKDYGSNTWRLVHVLRDNLGSITHVIDTTGIVLQELAYTAWGQLRGPLTASIYGPDNQPELLLGRGYTGHEHLPWFGLINMNARLYDPAVGRFLSPDPFVQIPDNTQNFNRYSYCMNNPLKFTDPDGKVFWAVPILIGAAVGAITSGATYAISAAITRNWDSGVFWKSVGLGAIGGAVASGLSFASNILANGSMTSIGRLGLNIGTRLIGQTANYAISKGIFNQRMNFLDVFSIFGSSLFVTGLPDFKGISGVSAIGNGFMDIAYNTYVGSFSGLVQGSIQSLYGGCQDIPFAIIGGTLSGLSRSAAKNIIFGLPFMPSMALGGNAIYRNGGLMRFAVELFFPDKVMGITLGQTLCVSDNTKLNLIGHEFYHYMQQNSMHGGWSEFYAQVMYEYLRFGFNGSYDEPGSLENNARIFQGIIECINLIRHER